MTEPLPDDLARRLGALDPAARQALLHRLGGAGVAPRDDGPTPDGGDRHPLAPVQRHLLDVARGLADTPLLTMPAAFEVRGPLDVAGLADRLRWLVEHHHPLRSRFVDDEVEVAPNRFRLVVSDDDPRAVVAEDAATPFDLTSGRLLRATLIRLGDDHHVLSLATHHLVFDGWSIGVLADVLAGRSRRPRISYGDAARWLVARLSERRDRELAFHRRIEPGPIIEVTAPLDVERVPLALTPRTSDIVVERCRQRNTTPFVEIASALARVVGPRVVVTHVGGRPHRDLETLVGLFTNLVPVPVTGDPAADRDAAVDALDHSSVPFEDVAADLEARGGDRRSLTGALVLVRNAPGNPPELPGVRTRPWVPARRLHPPPVSATPITIEIGTVRGRLQGTLQVARETGWDPNSLARDLVNALQRT